MKRKVAVNCIKCADPSSKCYIGSPGKCKNEIIFLSKGKVFDIKYDDESIKDCDECEGLGIVSDIEEIKWYKSFLYWLLK